MDKIAILLRVLKLYGHNAHNLAKGPTFLPDHELFGTIYEEADEDYDGVIERMIGLGMNPDLINIQKMAVTYLEKYPHEVTDNRHCFEFIMETEKRLSVELNKVCKSGMVTEGTRQMLGDVANRSEMRQYKIGQRLK